MINENGFLLAAKEKAETEMAVDKSALEALKKDAEKVSAPFPSCSNVAAAATLQMEVKVKRSEVSKEVVDGEERKTKDADESVGKQANLAEQQLMMELRAKKEEKERELRELQVGGSICN